MKKKIENFFYYYKFHVIGVLFAIFVVCLLVSSWKAKEETNLKFVIVDDTSQMNLTVAGELLSDFLAQTDLSEDEAAFQYRTMYLEQDDFKDVSFGIAGIQSYEDRFLDGSINFVICTADRLEESISENVLLPDEYFSESELEQYHDSIYYVEEKPVGIIFDKCKKAKEFFGDDYPTDYHYILQITKGAADDKYTKAFLAYLLNE